MFDYQFLLKFALGTVYAVMLFCFLNVQFYFAWSRRKFVSIYSLCFIGSRLGLFVLFYLVLQRAPDGDIFMLDLWTQKILDGNKLYSAAVPSCYSPLYHYITALAKLIYPSYKSIVLQAVFFEIIALAVWYECGKLIFEEMVIRRALIIYFCSPVVLMSTAFSGQTQSWVALFLGLSCWTFLKSKSIQSGVWLGVSVVAVKFLPLLYIPALFVLNKGKYFYWGLGLLLPIVIVYGFFCWIGVDVFFPFFQLSKESSSGNIPFLLTLLNIPFHNLIYQKTISVLGVLCLGVLALCVLKKSWGGGVNPKMIFYLIVIFQCTLMLVSKKSHTAYIAMCYMAFTYVIAAFELSVLEKILLSIFQVVGCVEQGFWFRTLGMKDFSYPYRNTLSVGEWGQYGILLGLELIVLIFFAWCLIRTVYAWSSSVHTNRRL